MAALRPLLSRGTGSKSRRWPGDARATREDLRVEFRDKRSFDSGDAGSLQIAFNLSLDGPLPLLFPCPPFRRGVRSQVKSPGSGGPAFRLERDVLPEYFAERGDMRDVRGVEFKLEVTQQMGN